MTDGATDGVAIYICMYMYIFLFAEHKEETSVLVDGFLRFMEVMNKLRRPMRKHRKLVHSLSCGSPRRVSAPLMGSPQVSVSWG